MTRLWMTDRQFALLKTGYASRIFTPRIPYITNCTHAETEINPLKELSAGLKGQAADVWIQAASVKNL